MEKILKVFIDANIFFAAIRSPKGGSGFVLELAKKGKLKIVTLTQVLLEAERNIRKKLGVKYLNRHYQNLLEIKPEIQSIRFITLEEIVKLKKLLPQKDIPILYGAIISGADFLITLDRRHFLGNEKLRKLKLHIKIVNPENFLKEYLERI